VLTGYVLPQIVISSVVADAGESIPVKSSIVMDAIAVFDAI